jgi:hypothetical protein
MSVPPRLSNQQKFTLAYLYDFNTTNHSCRLQPISREAAKEFDGLYDRSNATNDIDDTSSAMLLRSIFDSLDKQKVVTNEHSASFSRSIDRLHDRELIWKNHNELYDEYYEGNTLVSHHRYSRQASWIGLTSDGESVGAELLRQHNDGRYSLSFTTLD